MEVTDLILDWLTVGAVNGDDRIRQRVAHVPARRDVDIHVGETDTGTRCLRE